DHVGWPYRPEGLTSAQLNLPYCAATLLVEGDAFVDQFTEAAVANPRRMALAQRITVVHDPAITALGGKFRHKVRVEVYLKNGGRLEETVEAARGSEDKFASDADVIGKFRTLAAHALPRPKVDRLVDIIMSLEDIQDAAAVPQALAAG